MADPTPDKPLSGLQMFVMFFVACFLASASTLALEWTLTSHIVPTPVPGPPDQPPVPVSQSFVSLGQTYGMILKSAHADGWDAYADAMESGSTGVVAEKAYSDTWNAKVKAEYEAKIKPSQAKIMADPHSDPTTAQRASLVKMGHDMAKGLRK